MDSQLSRNIGRLKIGSDSNRAREENKCISHLSHWCDKSNLRKSLFWLTVLEHTVHLDRKGIVKGEGGILSLCIHSRKADNDEHWCSVTLLLFFFSPTHSMGPSTFKLYLPTSVYRAKGISVPLPPRPTHRPPEARQSLIEMLRSF